MVSAAKSAVVPMRSHHVPLNGGVLLAFVGVWGWALANGNFPAVSSVTAVSIDSLAR